MIEACFSLVAVAWFSSFEAVAPICDVKKVSLPVEILILVLL